MKLQRDSVLFHVIIVTLVLSISAALFNIVIIYKNRFRTAENYEHLQEYSLERAFYCSKIMIEIVNIVHIRQDSSPDADKRIRDGLTRIKSHFTLYRDYYKTRIKPGKLNYLPDYQKATLLTTELAFQESYARLIQMIEAELSSPSPDLYTFIHTNYADGLEPFLLNMRRYNDSLLQISGIMFSHVYNTQKNIIITLQISMILIILIMTGILVLFLIFRTSQQKYAHELYVSSQETENIITSMMNAYALHEVILDGNGRPVDYRFIDVNPAFCSTVNMERDTLIGSTVKTLLPTTEDFWIERYGKIALQGGNDHFTHHDRNFDRTFEVQAFSPEPGKFATIFQDVSARERLIRELKDAKKHVDAADRLKDQFLANINHEMRTPLNGILGMSELLEMTDLSAEQSELLALLKDSANDLTDTVRQLLDFNIFTRGTRGISRAPVDIHSLFDHLCRFSALRAKKYDVIFDPDTSVSSVKIISDESRLFQIVWSILDNAFKYAQGGKVSFHVQTGEELHFIIRDTGPGIPRETEKHMFDLFYRGVDAYTRTHRGIGMGLAIARVLTDQLGGKIAYSRPPEGGSLFEVSFPLTIGNEYSARNADDSGISVPALKPADLKPVLIAEDEAINRLYLRTILRNRGFHTLEAKDGEEAIRLFHEYDLSCILMDIGMPRINGLDASANIRAGNHYPDIPIIAVTAHNAEEDKKKFRTAGINAIISKPVDIAYLEETILKLVDKRNSG